MSLPKVLFIGSFLSKKKGTKGVSEKIADSALNQSFHFELVSRFQNQLLRLVHMLFKSLIFTGKTVHIDVFSGRAFQYATWVATIAALKRKNIIMTLRGGALPDFTDIRKAKVLKTLAKASRLQSPSKYLIAYYKNLGLTVNYLPNPIDLSKFPYKRDEVKPYSILWVRAFTSIYNPEIPVKVLKELLAVFPDARLTMVGPDRGLQSSVMELATRLGIYNKVAFEGPVPNDQLHRYYQSHQVYLNTTSYESFGVAAIEAAACGIPMVSNPVGEIPYLWKNEFNILFAEQNEVANFVQQVKQVFTNAELQFKLSKNARQNIEQFSWKLIKPKWHSLLSQESNAQHN